MKWWLGILTGIVAMMLTMLVASWLNGVPRSSDSATLLISVLGVIVTGLVGWQVFNAIENTKTLRKLENLETKLNIQLNLSERRNQELFDIAEAHRLEQEADKSTDNAYKYSCHLRALLLYVKSNVSFSYPPLCNKVSYLEMLVSKVSQQKDEDKILFARQMGVWEQWYDELLDAITIRDEDLRKFRREIIALHNRRKYLFDKYIDLETSIDKMQMQSNSNNNQNHNAL